MRFIEHMFVVLRKAKVFESTEDHILITVVKV